MQLPAGLLFDRFSVIYILPCAAFLSAMGVILMSEATTVVGLVFARLLGGMGSAFGFIGMLKVVRLYFPRRSFGFMVGISESIGFMGTAYCEYLLTYYLPDFGWRGTLFALGMVGLCIAALVCVSMIAIRRVPLSQASSPATVEDLGSHSQIQQLMIDLKFFLANRAYWVFGLMSFCFFSVITAFSALWGVPILVNLHHVSVLEAGKAVSLIFWGIAVGGPVIGFLGMLDRSWVKRFCLMGGIACAACLFVLVVFSELNDLHLSFTMIQWLNFGAGVGCTAYMLCFLMADERTPIRLSATCAGFINMVTMASALLIQPVMGYLLGLYGPVAVLNNIPSYDAMAYQRAGLVLVGLMLLASIMSLTLDRYRLISTYQQETTPA
jgi:MFS family permease